MPTYAELIKILNASEIRGYSHYTKSKHIDLLIKRGLIPEKYVTNKQVKAKMDILNIICKADMQQSKEVWDTWHDLKTDKVVPYLFIYKTALAVDQNPRVIGMYNGKVWRNRYAIRVLTESES